jgi:hypothetical protein
VNERKCPLCGSDPTQWCYGHGSPGPTLMGFTAQSCSSRSCGLPCRVWEQIERLRAIVDRLPKTADGVPVVPGMTAFALMPTTDGTGKCIYPVEMYAIQAGGKYTALYSTREAAEAAGGA